MLFDKQPTPSHVFCSPDGGQRSAAPPPFGGFMTHRKLLAGATVALLCLAAGSNAAEAAWEGATHFTATKGSWALDGLYGPRTIAAVGAFQQAHGMHVDGIAGPATRKALGLPAQRSLKLGMGGADVFALQRALVKAGFWYGKSAPGAKAAAPKPAAKPSAKPTPKPKPVATPKPKPTPSAGWMEPPVMQTPSPERTETPVPAPTPMSEPTPAPESSMAPEGESMAPTNQPTVELGGGTWFVPGAAGGTAYDFSFARPTWTGDATLWLGDVGIGGDLTVFNTTYAAFRTTPYFAANTMMYDGLLKYRFDRGFYQVFAGYRGIGQADVNFGTLGLGLERPLVGEWLWLQAKGQGGHNFATSYFLDGQAGLELRLAPVALDLGFRHLLLQAGADPQFNLNGPTAGLKIRF
jgi:peptidoglycan hydrolase-like protein with peptidoglycan-binding domain